MLEKQYDLPENNTFSPWDYVVFSIVLAVSAGIGIYYGCTGGKQKTTQEFLMADRQMTVLPVSLSLLASFMSAITLLGTPAEIYRFGTQYWLIWLGYLLMIPMSAHIFIPIFFNMKYTSVFEYLEMRFCLGLRICGSIAFIIQTILYMSIVLYAPSLALSAVTGLNVWITVFSVGVVCTFYTALGGIKAVMWTDTFQIVIMFAGLVAVIIQGSIDHGGFGNLWKNLEDGERVEFFNFNTDPRDRHTVWGLAIGGCFTWLAIYGVNQSQVQRALTVPKVKQAQTAMWINFPGLTALLTVCSLCGMVVYSDFKDCDPLTTKRIDAADQLLPLYVMDRLTHMKGVPGLFTACLFSGALSTISSGLNSLSAVVLQDIVRRIFYPQMTEARATLVSKLLSVVFGAICISLTFVAAQLGSVLQAALAVFGMIGGPQLGMYMLGMLYPCANTVGAYAGFFSALVATLWLGIGAQVYKPSVYKPPVSTLGCEIWVNTTDAITTAAPVIPASERAGYLSFYEISYIWYSTFAVGVVGLVGITTSIIAAKINKDNAKEVDPRLLCPIFDIFCCCLPKKLREFLRCGVNHENKYDEDETGNKQPTENGVHHEMSGADNPAYSPEKKESLPI